MKTTFDFKTLVFIFLIATACQSNSKAKDGEGVIRDSSAMQSYEIYRGDDTCNRMDIIGRKQGKWYIFDKQHQLKDALYYKNGVVVEEK